MAQYTENMGIDDQPKVGLAQFQKPSLFRSGENFQRFIFVIASPQTLADDEAHLYQKINRTIALNPM
jgi:hypothetical protein